MAHLGPVRRLIASLGLLVMAFAAPQAGLAAPASSPPRPGTHGIFVARSRFVALGDRPGGKGTTCPWGINDRGQIVGVYGAFPNQRLFRWDHGVYSTLELPGGRGTLLDGPAINNEGEVLGNFRDGDNRSHGLLWSHGVCTTIDASSIDASSTGGTVADFLGDDGRIIGGWGNGWTEDGRSHLFVLSRGKYANFALPEIRGGSLAGFKIVRLCFNNRGQAVITYESLQQHLVRVYLLSGGVCTRITAPRPVGIFYANSINDACEVVGYYVDAGRARAFLWSHGVFTQIVPPKVQAIGASALSINNKGQIVGFYSDTAGASHGFLLSR